MKRLEEDNKRSHTSILKEEAYQSLKQLLDGECNVEHPKVRELLEILSQQVRSNSNSRILVFTQYRDTASHLVDEMKKVEGIRAKRFVGQASKVDDRGLTQDEQASLLEDLRGGNINTICCTSIAEEGLDIPEVDLVVFYEPIPSEIRYIQRRGRTGRRAAGRVMILAAEGTNDVAYLAASQRRAEKMKSIANELNKKLKPVLRLIGKPKPNPMTEEEIEKLDESPRNKVQEIRLNEEESEYYYQEEEKVKDFDRLVRRAQEAAYMRMLESGLEGLDSEKLYSEMEEEGYPRNVVKVALQKLAKKRYVSQNKENTKAAVSIKEIPDAKVMDIQVEKVLPGEAIVLVGGKWRARLDPSGYNGPRQLIKKNARFRGLCELYESSGVLHVNVRQVIETTR